MVHFPTFFCLSSPLPKSLTLFPVLYPLCTHFSRVSTALWLNLIWTNLLLLPTPLHCLGLYFCNLFFSPHLQVICLQRELRKAVFKLKFLSCLLHHLGFPFFPQSVRACLLAQQQPVTEHVITAISAMEKRILWGSATTAAKNNSGGLDIKSFLLV